MVIFLFAVFLFAGLYIVPSYMRFIQRYYAPTIGSLFVGVLSYINLSFTPVYICLILAWRVFTTLRDDNAFCAENARRLHFASLLAMIDVGMVILFYLFTQVGFSWLISPLFLFATLCLILLGISAALVCFALSKLVAQAAELKQEVDLTV